MKLSAVTNKLNIKKGGLKMLVEDLLDRLEYLYVKKEYESLIKACDELLKIDAQNPIAMNYKAISLYYLERYGESMKVLNDNLNLHPNNCYTLNNMALVYIALGKYEEALRCCDEGLKHKDFNWLKINRIEALINLGRIDEAYEFYKSVDIPFYTFDDAMENCGKSEKRSIKKVLDEMFKSERYEDVISLSDDLNESEMTLDYKIVSLVYLKRLDEALEACDKAVLLYPHNYEFYFLKAKISALSGRFDDAIESYEKEFSITGVNNYRMEVNNCIDCLLIRADELARKGDYNAAIEIYEKILSYRRDRFLITGKIDYLVENYHADYTPSENYLECLKNKKELQKRIDILEIGECDINQCLEFRDYESFEEYVVDVMACMLKLFPHSGEKRTREFIKHAIGDVSDSFYYELPAFKCALLTEYME